MSLDGSSASYLPYTINGLQEIAVDASTVNTLQVNSLTPNKVVVADSSNYLTSASASTTEVDYLVGTTSNVQAQLNAKATTAYVDAENAAQDLVIATKASTTYVDTNFLNKTTASSQTVQASTTFLNGLTTADDRPAILGSRVVVGANYQSILTSADVSVGQYFGTITNVGSTYQSTSTGSSPPILVLFPITAGKRYTLTIEVLGDDSTYDTTLDIYQSQDNVSPYPNYNDAVLDSPLFAPASTVFHQTNATFVATTTGSVVLNLSPANPSGISTVQWKNMYVYEMGVALTNVSLPAQLEDRVAVINDKKQLVSSGISTTKLGYLDNVSSDLQTQLNTLSTNKADITYVDTQDGLRVLKAGDTMTGALTVDATVSVGNRLLGTPDGSPGYFWIGLRGSGSEADRLAIGLTGDQTTGVVSSVIMSKPLNLDTNKITTTYVPVNPEDVANKAYVDAGGTGVFLPLTGGNLTGNLSSDIGTYVNFGETLKTVATDKGYTGASFTVSTAEVPAGVQTGTLSGTYRLTANSGYAVMAMAIADLNATYQFNEYYTFTFTGMAGSVPLTLTVYQDTTPRVAVNITTSPQTITAKFTTGMGSGKIYFNFQALSANPYVDWTGFTMTRADTQMNGNVGIGTAPNAQLHLSNTVGNRKIVLFDGGDDHQYYGFGINPYTLRYQVSGVLAKHAFYAGASSTTSTELMRIQGDGKVGIGTANPEAKLHVAESPIVGDVSRREVFRGTRIGTSAVQNSVSTAFSLGASTTGINPYGVLDIKANGFPGPGNNYGLIPDITVMSIVGNGRVGIGLTDPSAPLTVNGSITIRNGANVYEAGCIYTDVNWGMLFRGAVNAAVAHMRWDRSDGTVLMKIQNTGVLNFTGGGANYAVDNGQTTRQGAVVIGSIGQSYGGGWQAGLLLECLDTQEISCHDSGNRLTSFMYYDGGNRLYLGRDIGWGGTPVIAPTSFTTPYVSYSGTSDCAIYNGNIDTYNPTGTNNLMIKSWWGIGFISYDGGVRIAMDTRSGASYFGGQMTLQGTPLSSRIHKVIPVIEVNGNWNGSVRSYQFRLDVTCEVRFHGYCTYYAPSVGFGNANLRLYNYDTGQTWVLFMGKYFNINYNHETIGVERYELLPAGWYQVYVYADYNCSIDSGDQIFVSGIAYQ